MPAQSFGGLFGKDGNRCIGTFWPSRPLSIGLDTLRPIPIGLKTRRSSSAVPETQDFDGALGFCDAVKNQIGSANQLTNISPSPHEPASMRKTNQGLGFSNQTITKSDCCMRIVLSDKSDNFTKVVAGWFCQHYFVIHDCICVFISSRLKTLPSSAA
jgi:hypothetical protein